ncbi:efflux RND transporter periplasmic adaptor subunit [Stieleria sp. TO1_6]|uniref:efflux RND transporter periplasmic adaptor subunit n=1 Tax=Stieleria tagensis TaxID=2956795 RepID=UPI00209AB460|nr:efflux RND transporter periplasmic adaptor subunit [Stieleria tagensis]MCO8123889.1 efflux RND transporter periplasmic adaptor subunit [Stieleria tagensis]
MTHSFTPLQLICLFSTLGLVGCGRSTSPDRSAPPPPAVSVSTPLVKSIVEWDEFTGRLEAVDFVQVRSRVGGYLLDAKSDQTLLDGSASGSLGSKSIQDGDDVSKGDLLFIVDQRPYRAAVDNAKAAVEEAKASLTQSNAQLAQANAIKESATAEADFAETDYDRQKSLQKQNATSQSAVELSRNQFLKARGQLEGANAGIALAQAAIATSTAAIESAKARLREAELNLEYTEIRAPITGRISRRYVTKGNLISGGSEQSTLLTTIVSLDPIYFVFDASEQQVLKFKRLVQEGARRSVRDVRYATYLELVDEDNFPHIGFIDFVDNRFDPNTATMTARARFQNPDGLLTPGMFAKARIASSTKYDALLVPDEAIGADQSDKFVYVLDAENKAQMRVIETGPLAYGLRVIRNGISADDRVVISGLQRVRANNPVQVLSAEKGAKTIVAVETEDSQQPELYEASPNETPTEAGVETPTGSTSDAAADPAKAATADDPS